MLYSSVYTSVPGGMGSLMSGSIVFCCTWARSWITTCPPRCIMPKDGWPFLRQGASSTFPFEPASTTWSLLALDYLWQSFVASSHIGFVTLHLVGEDHGWLFFTIPPRSAVVI